MNALKSELPAHAYPKILQGIKLNEEAERRFKQISSSKDPDQYILDKVVPVLSPDIKKEWEKAQYAYEVCSLEKNKERHKKNPTLLQKMVRHFCEQLSVEDIQQILSSQLIEEEDVEFLVGIFFSSKPTIDEACKCFFKKLLKVHQFTHLGVRFFMNTVKQEQKFFVNGFNEQQMKTPDGYKSEPLSIEKDGPRSEPSSPSRIHLEKEEKKKMVMLVEQHSIRRTPQNRPSILKGEKSKKFKEKVPNLGIIQIIP